MRKLQRRVVTYPTPPVFENSPSSTPLFRDVCLFTLEVSVSCPDPGAVLGLNREHLSSHHHSRPTFDVNHPPPTEWLSSSATQLISQCPCSASWRSVRFWVLTFYYVWTPTVLRADTHLLHCWVSNPVVPGSLAGSLILAAWSQLCTSTLLSPPAIPPGQCWLLLLCQC